MSGRDENLIWYASYGSNCSASRFNAYLAGHEIPGTDRTQRGAHDPRPSRGFGAVEFPHQICFRGHSHLWDGAPAFLEHRASSRGAFGRRYLITWAQFDDVVAQECQRDSTRLDLEGLAVGGRRTTGPGYYSSLLALDSVDGIPVVTFTSPTPPEVEEPSPPSEAYLSNIVGGLAADGELSIGEIATRLLAASGVSPHWDRATIEALARTGG